MIERIFSIALFIISILGYYMARGFESGFMVDSGLGAGFFPQLVCIVLGVLAIIMFLNSFKEKEVYKFTKDSKNTFLIIGACICYIAVMDRIGYLVSTVLFSFCVIRILSKKITLVNLIFSILFPVGIYYLFSKVFSVSLPTGII